VRIYNTRGDGEEGGSLANSWQTREISSSDLWPLSDSRIHQHGLIAEHVTNQ
jgi:hypothetical protein